MKWLAANQCNTFLHACLGCCPCFPEWGSVSLLGCQGLKRYSCLNWKAEVMRRFGPNSHYMRHSPQDKSKNTTLGKTLLDNCRCGFVQRVHVLRTFDVPGMQVIKMSLLTSCDCGIDYNYHTCGLHSSEHLELFLRCMKDLFFFPCFSISGFCSNSTWPKLIQSNSGFSLYWPIRCGQVFLLLELLLQAHQLHLGEDGATASRLLQTRRAALRLRLAANAEGGLTRWGLGASRVLRRQQGQVRGRWDTTWGRHLREVGGLPRDHWEEGVGT